MYGSIPQVQLVRMLPLKHNIKALPRNSLIHGESSVDRRTCMLSALCSRAFSLGLFGSSIASCNLLPTSSFSAINTLSILLGVKHRAHPEWVVPLPPSRPFTPIASVRRRTLCETTQPLREARSRRKLVSRQFGVFLSGLTRHYCAFIF